MARYTAIGTTMAVNTSARRTIGQSSVRGLIAVIPSVTRGKIASHVRNARTWMLGIGGGVGIAVGSVTSSADGARGRDAGVGVVMTTPTNWLV